MPDSVDTTTVLLGAAASLAIVHTLIGIDHSLPLAALGRARGWALGRTLLVTGVCGAGHVASSVVLGAAGVGLGVATDSLLRIESARGEVAAALLLAFGLAYAVWALSRRAAPDGSARRSTNPAGIRAVLRRRLLARRAAPDGGRPAPADLVPRTADEADGGSDRRIDGPAPAGRAPRAVERPDAAAGDVRGVTAWALFVVFVLGPCEPLIPLMAAPGLAGDWLAVAAVAAVFGLLTIGVMLAAVAAAWYGMDWMGWPGRHRDVRLAHAAAGFVAAASGAAVLWLSL